MAQREFIEWAKGLAKGMSREELMDFFLFLAGKVSEEKRAAFRAAAEEYARYTAGSGSAGERRAALDAREAEAILREKERLKGLFERIRKEELRMKAGRGQPSIRPFTWMPWRLLRRRGTGRPCIRRGRRL